jgi:hypothetical protein
MLPASETRERVRALWTARFGQPPVLDCEPEMIIEALVASLPSIGYGGEARARPVEDEAASP